MRICAGGLLFARAGCFLARRSGGSILLSPACGTSSVDTVSGDEAPADALVRELREEIGVTARAFDEIAVLPEAAAYRARRGAVSHLRRHGVGWRRAAGYRVPSTLICDG